MFADPNDTTATSLVTEAGAVLVALIAGGVALWSNRKSNRNTVVIQDVKSGIDRDLERLKAKLEHGQLVSSTQWNAEFKAYQELWESFVALRSLSIKLVTREGELAEIGMEAGDVPEDKKIKIVQNILKQQAEAASTCMRAINRHAPFYAADIRKKANIVQGLAYNMFQANLAALVARMKGQSLTADEQKTEFERRESELIELIAGIDNLEEMIRSRMSEVRVLNPAIV